jgi:hypothetical protein
LTQDTLEPPLQHLGLYNLDGSSAPICIAEQQKRQDQGVELTVGDRLSITCSNRKLNFSGRGQMIKDAMKLDDDCPPLEWFNEGRSGVLGKRGRSSTNQRRSMKRIAVAGGGKVAIICSPSNKLAWFSSRPGTAPEPRIKGPGMGQPRDNPGAPRSSKNFPKPGQKGCGGRQSTHEVTPVSQEPAQWPFSPPRRRAFLEAPRSTPEHPGAAEKPAGRPVETTHWCIGSPLTTRTNYVPGSGARGCPPPLQKHRPWG